MIRSMIVSIMNRDFFPLLSMGKNIKIHSAMFNTGILQIHT